MMGIHLLLTYKCNRECDHCAFYCSPSSGGTFTARQIDQVLLEARKIGTVEWIYFEGGEPFLFHDLLLEGLEMAKELGFKTGIATNAYWATSIEEATRLLKPISKLGVSLIGISEDLFHSNVGTDNHPAKNATRAAEMLGIKVIPLHVKNPNWDKIPGEMGRIAFKGRAAEKLTGSLPKQPWKILTRCPNRNLRILPKVHVDPLGTVHICQGISIGNMWETPLSELVASYDVNEHPICSALWEGGPARMAEKFGVKHELEYVNGCHFCFSIRKKLIDEFPEYLAPRQVYGL
ncbi:MAG: radical SAM protein [Candidatus Hodarchaeota archaeon]